MNNLKGKNLICFLGILVIFTFITIALSPTKANACYGCYVNTYYPINPSINVSNGNNGNINNNYPQNGTTNVGNGNNGSVNTYYPQSGTANVGNGNNGSVNTHFPQSNARNVSNGSSPKISTNYPQSSTTNTITSAKSTVTKTSTSTVKKTTTAKKTTVKKVAVADSNKLVCLPATSINSNARNGSLTASAIFGSDGFMPTTFLQWILLAILVLLIVIIWRKISKAGQKYKAAPLKQA